MDSIPQPTDEVHLYQKFKKERLHHANPKRKTIIFLAFTNVRNDFIDYLRNLPNEQRQIREALEKVRVAGLCKIVERSPKKTTREILDVFQHPEYRNRIAIFHYGGHAKN